MENYKLSHIKELESEAIYIIREVAAEFKNPVMLYSVGKDSSCLLHLARKAFYPGKVPFPLMHIDTGYKPKQMTDFRDYYTKKVGVKLIVEQHEKFKQGLHPAIHGVDTCCSYLKTQALLDSIDKHGFDAAIGGARRDEEKSRAKERVYSHRNSMGKWDPKNQRPELWHNFNSHLNKQETMRVFPLSNWTESDVWNYIKEENIEIVPLYFAKKRKVVRRNGLLVPVEESTRVKKDEKVGEVMCRFRSLGCVRCTGAVESSASTVEDILKEVLLAKKSERENRIIDHSGDSSMEDKKQSGYF